MNQNNKQVGLENRVGIGKQIKYAITTTNSFAKY